MVARSAAGALREISGIEPERAGLHVLLEPFGVHSTQRLALSGIGEGLVAGLWPAELKTQAQYLYSRRLARPMIERARQRGWSVEANPHIAFRNSSAGQRLYMRASLDAGEYAGRWEEGDLNVVGQYGRDKVKTVLWPWLKERGYVGSDDDAVLEGFLTTQLGNRPAYLRPGLRFKRLWDREAVEADTSRTQIVTAIRADVNAILAAAHEPPLPSPGVSAGGATRELPGGVERR